MNKLDSRFIGSWAGMLPALGYSLAVGLGGVFGIRGPARWLADVLMMSTWTGPVLYFLLFGGLAIPILNGLLAEGSSDAAAKTYGAAGWCAFALLLITVPLLMFQVVFVFTELD